LRTSAIGCPKLYPKATQRPSKFLQISRRLHERKAYPAETLLKVALQVRGEGVNDRASQDAAEVLQPDYEFNIVANMGHRLLAAKLPEHSCQAQRCIDLFRMHVVKVDEHPAFLRCAHLQRDGWRCAEFSQSMIEHVEFIG
jgi:hypothetical protein